MEQNLWLAAHRFSFWYWKLGGTVKKGTLYILYSTKLFRNCTQRFHLSAIKLHGIWEAARNVHIRYNINIFWYVQFLSRDINLICNALFWTSGFLYIKIFCGGVHVIQETGSIAFTENTLKLWHLYHLVFILSSLNTYTAKNL